jgi:pimeloyl-ACP methyl ester carboxylesterase
MTAVLDALDLARVDVLGQSWGGVLALEFSLRFPDRVRTLIAADTAFELPRMERGFEAWRCFPRCRPLLLSVQRLTAPLGPDGRTGGGDDARAAGARRARFHRPRPGGDGPRPPTQRQLGPVCRLPALPFFEDPKQYLHTINTFLQNTAIQRHPACCDRSSA